MSEREITYAGMAYFDRTRGLVDGSIQPQGCKLRFLPFPAVGDLFRRMAQDAEFDASEMSLSTYMLLRGRGDDRLVGIPVFPSRAFRHGQVYVHVESGIEEPADLAGCAVGVPEYQMTAALWVRAFLQHDYGLSPTAPVWWTGGIVTPVYRERLPHDPPPGVTIRRIPADRALEEMLDAGDLDAMVTVRAPLGFDESGGGPVRRLFPDYRSVEQDYYRRTGFFPIMHMVVMRRDLYESEPSLAVSLLEAFHQAKETARNEMFDTSALAVMHPWIADELRQVKDLFSGDPFAYGFEANRAILEAMTTYSHEQGLTPHRLDPADLFAPETLAWKP